MLDCFVPRNDGYAYRHCEERSNPVRKCFICFARTDLLMKKRQTFYLFVILSFSMLAGCADFDNYSTNPNHRLSFSVDTLSFDTIFTSIGSTTRQFMIYNRGNEALRIESIVLANAGKSGFRINVDGRKGDAFQGIDIWGKDSLFISVEITVNPNCANQPLIVEDSILFLTNGNRQSVLLQAYGQDIHLIKGGVVFTKDTTLTADLPYLVYDSLIIAEGVTVTIAEGATFYMHYNANLTVSGTIKARGTQEKPVVFRGDRLDYIPLKDKQLSYDLIPGLWGGIFFNATSFENEFEHVIARNGSSGLIFRESVPDRLKISINNSQITNMDTTLFMAINCHIEAANSEFSNSSKVTVELIGGKYQFTHCTLVNYKVLGKFRDTTSPCLLLANQMENGEKTSFPLQQAYFENCIIDANYSADSTKQYRGQLLFITNGQDEAGNDETFNYRFISSFIKTARVTNDRFVQCLFVNSPSYLKIGVIEDEYDYEYDFRLANESTGIGSADRSISEKYPVDRYGINRLTSSTGPSVGAYEYVYQKKEEQVK